MIAALALGGRRVVRGGLAGVEEVVAAQACKAALHSETGAAAVDMESHIAAAYAAEAGFPLPRCGSSAIPPAGRCRRWRGRAIKPNGDIDLRKSCAAWCAIPRRCARWSRPASISTARCAPCAAAAASCSATARARSTAANLTAAACQDKRPDRDGDRAFLSCSVPDLRATRRVEAFAARPCCWAASRLVAANLRQPLLHLLPRRCTAPDAACRGRSPAPSGPWS